MSRLPFMLAPLAVLLLAAVSAPRAARGEVLPLEETERRALANENLRAEVGAIVADAEAGLDEARAPGHPRAALTLDGSVAPGGQLIDVRSDSGDRFLVQGSRTLGQTGAFTALPRYGVGVTVQETILDFGRVASAERGAAHRLRSAQLEAEGMRRRILTTVRRAYLDWLVAFSQHRLLHERVTESETDAQRTEDRIAEGARPSSERNAARRALVAARLDEEQSASDLDRTRLALGQLMSAPLDEAAEPDPSLLDAAAVSATPPSDLEAQTIAQNAEALAAQAEGFRLRSAPVIAASGELGVRGQSDLLFPTYRLGLMISVPFWDGGASRAEARAATAQADRLRARARTSARGALDERAQVASEWKHANETVRLAEELRDLAREALAQAAERYRIGSVDLAALADARGRVVQADLGLLAAKRARAEAALRLRSDANGSGESR
jgi:outer membrane protein TolC